MLLVTLFAFLFKAHAQNYDYPYTDPYLATVSTGLLKNPGTAHFEDRQITIQLITGNAAERPLAFRVYPVTDGDLVILIPGLGATISDPLPNFLACEIARAGHSVLIMPNDFTPEFAQGASRTGIVGVASLDAEDMRVALDQVLRAIPQTLQISVSAPQLVGYSLGGLLAGFVVAQEQVNPNLNIQKTILINPPIHLLQGIQNLDALGAVGSTLTAEQKLALDVREVDLGVKVWTGNELNPNYFMNPGSYLPVSETDLKYLVGENFYSSLQTIFHWITQKNDRDHIPNVPLASFQVYMDKVVVTQLAPTFGLPTNTTDLTEQESLPALYDFFQQASDVYLMDNDDDLLLEASDPEYLQQWFGSRLVRYPLGGHLGNVWYPQNQADLIKLLAL